MEEFQACSDTSDLRELSLPQQLYLKPEAKLSISVALPNVRLPGKTISNWEVMERIRQVSEPDQFIMLKVVKSTMEFIRFEGEIENRSQMPGMITRLDGKVIRLSGFPEPLKIRTAEAKPDFPSRHDWDKFFRDAKNMNEMKAGERPDTIHLTGLPSKWFVSARDRRNGSLIPSEFTLTKVFEIFGEVRCVDIPMLDPYRNDMKSTISGVRTFCHVTDATFEAYVQYREYISFVKAMDSWRGMKLVHRDAVKCFSASVKVDFDKTRHLSDMSIHRRRIEREKLMEKERKKEEEKRREEEAVRMTLASEEQQRQEEKRLKGERRKEREEKRKQRILKKLKKKEAEQMNIKIAIEERKLLMAQRKLESIRLLDELFERIKVEVQKEITKEKEKELEMQLSKVKKKKEAKLRKNEEKEQRKRDKLLKKEKKLRKKLMKKIKLQQEQQMEERRERLRKTLEGKVYVKGSKGKAAHEVPEEASHFTDAGASFIPPPGYSMPFPPYRGYSYRGWMPRGGFMPRGYFPPRRPHRPYRGFGPYPPPWNPRGCSEWQHDDRDLNDEDKSKEKNRDDSDGESSATSKYSNLDFSDEEKKKKDDATKPWPGYQGMMPMHPWGEYSDYYHPRFMRRGRGTYRGPYRGGPRHFHPQEPNPNVPTNSYYMKSINEQYYRYFNRLAKGDEKDEENSRSRSKSSERVVCRKVLSRSRSRSRSRSYSRSRSHHRSRTRSRSRSRSRRRSRSHSKSRHRSNSRSSYRSKSRTRRSRTSRSKSRSKSRSRARSRSRSKSRSRNPAKSRSRNRSKSQSKARSKSRSKARSKSRSKTPSNSKKSEHISRSRSKSRNSSTTKKSEERNKKSRSKSKEKSHASPRQDQKNPGKSTEITPSCSQQNVLENHRETSQPETEKENFVGLYEGLNAETDSSAVNGTCANEQSIDEEHGSEKQIVEENAEMEHIAGIKTIADEIADEGVQEVAEAETKTKQTEVKQIEVKQAEMKQKVVKQAEVPQAEVKQTDVKQSPHKLKPLNQISFHIDDAVLISDDEMIEMDVRDSKEMSTSKPELTTVKIEKDDDYEIIGSDLSLSLSDAIDGWSSPERKVKPIRNSHWPPPQRSYHSRKRSPDRRDSYRREYHYRERRYRERESYTPESDRYESDRHHTRNQPQVRSMVVQPKSPPRTRSPPIRSRVERHDGSGRNERHWKSSGGRRHKSPDWDTRKRSKYD